MLKILNIRREDKLRITKKGIKKKEGFRSTTSLWTLYLLESQLFVYPIKSPSFLISLIFMLSAVLLFSQKHRS